MRAVREPRLLRDIGQIAVCEEQKLLCLADADKLDIFLAGPSIQVVKALGKIRIAHTAQSGQLLHPEFLARVGVNVRRDIVQRDFIGVRQHSRIHVNAGPSPDAHDFDQKQSEITLDHEIIAVPPLLQLLVDPCEMLPEMQGVDRLLPQQHRRVLSVVHVPQNHIQLRHIGIGGLHTVGVKFDEPVYGVFLPLRVDRMHCLRADQQKISLPAVVNFPVIFHADRPGLNKNDFHIVMPVRRHRKIIILFGIIDSRLHRPVQNIRVFNQTFCHTALLHFYSPRRVLRHPHTSG